ncbi:MAG: FAD-dependent oxidoreductase [Candidatus Woykebacteria bacterium]
MKSTDYLIVGGGIAGTTAAEFIRMDDPSGSITIVMEEPERLYSRVMLPHYLRDQITFERLYVRKPGNYEEKHIELVKGVRANSIDTQNKKVTLSSGEMIDYDKLLIASGGKVNRLKVPGNDLPGVTYMRTIEDVRKIKKLMARAKNGVVVGGGFIGIEYAQSFVKAGIKTNAIIREPYFWSSVVGENMGKLINKILKENGVQIISNTEIDEFAGSASLEQVKISAGQSVPAEIAGVGIGIHMDLEHLKDSGLKINKGLITNEYLETETSNIWAAGDIAEFYDILFDKHHQMGNWSNAGAQGKAVGPNMVVGWGKSGREEFVTVSAYTISIFDKSFTFMGDPEASQDTEFVERGSVAEGRLARIHLRGDIITGAALINLPADRRPLEELIKNRVKIKVNREKLADTNFSFSELLPT